MPFFRELKRRNVIRVAVAYLAAAWVLTEVASTLLPLFGVPDWGIRLIVVLFAIGFIPTLIFSWVYELTPEGLKREKDVVRDNSITHFTAKRLDVITIVLIVVALGVVGVDRLWLPPRVSEEAAAPPPASGEERQSPEAAVTSYPTASIAVLPFVNMSDDPANEYFSDGISEELLNLLANIPELRVIARTSSFSFKGKDATVADIARALNVAHVLEGSVRKADNQVRITAQLIETGSETHLWSETYDRTLDDIFAIQDEIAGNVVEELKTALLGKAAPKARETNPEAYVWYLQCRPLSAGGLEESLRKGEEYCRRSLEIAPDYAPAWVSLAVVYTNLAVGGYIDYAQGYAQAHGFVMRALDLDPNLWSPYSWLGWYAAMHERDLATAAQYYRRALELAPSGSAISAQAASFARSLGRFERAIELTKRQLVLDPMHGSLYATMALMHCLLGQFEEANEQYEMAFELAPEDHFMLAGFAQCYLWQSQPDKALAVAEGIGIDARRLSISSMAHHELGRPEASDRMLNELVEEYSDEAASFIASVYAWRGEADPAFEWLSRAIEEKQYMWGWLVFDPAFSKLHGDPRWADIRARDGRSEEQLEAIDF